MPWRRPSFCVACGSSQRHALKVAVWRRLSFCGLRSLATLAHKVTVWRRPSFCVACGSSRRYALKVAVWRRPSFCVVCVVLTLKDCRQRNPGLKKLRHRAAVFGRLHGFVEGFLGGSGNPALEFQVALRDGKSLGEFFQCNGARSVQTLRFQLGLAELRR